jgi:hypothetical protein
MISIKEAAKLLKEKATSTKNIQVNLIENAAHSYIGFENELVEIIIDWVKKATA